MISVSNVTMRYGAKVLFDEVTTSFTPGKRYGLSGPNGAGKSTFMNLLTGALEPQKGTVARPRKLGVLSQDQFAFDRVRVRSGCSWPRRFSGIPRPCCSTSRPTISTWSPSTGCRPS